MSEITENKEPIVNEENEGIEKCRAKPSRSRPQAELQKSKKILENQPLVQPTEANGIAPISKKRNYIMTEARKLAFERAKEKRNENINLRKQNKMELEKNEKELIQQQILEKAKQIENKNNKKKSSITKYLSESSSSEEEEESESDTSSSSEEIIIVKKRKKSNSPTSKTTLKKSKELVEKPLQKEFQTTGSLLQKPKEEYFLF
jgi:hypothetical protein